MQFLKNMILDKAVVVSDKIIQVSSFINHQVDANLMWEIGKEFKKVFADLHIDKILTLESSGIAPAVFVALEFNKPLLFLKKHIPSSYNKENIYKKRTYSFTKEKYFDINCKEEFLQKGEKILIIDDILANGNGVFSALDIIGQAKAEVIGIGIVIEKTFQKGGELLREKGYNLHSIIKIKELAPDKEKKIIFE